MKIGEENFHDFWTSRYISTIFSKKNVTFIIFKVIKKQDFKFSLENAFLEIPCEGEEGGQIDRPTFLGLKNATEITRCDCDRTVW